MAKNISKHLKDFEMTEKEKYSQKERHYNFPVNKNYTAKTKYNRMCKK